MLAARRVVVPRCCADTSISPLSPWVFPLGAEAAVVGSAHNRNRICALRDEAMSEYPPGTGGGRPCRCRVQGWCIGFGSRGAELQATRCQFQCMHRMHAEPFSGERREALPMPTLAAEQRPQRPLCICTEDPARRSRRAHCACYAAAPVPGQCLLHHARPTTRAAG